MTEGGGDTLHATVVEGDDTTVAEGQLDLTLALLTGNLTCHRAIDLVRQPVLTGDGLQLEHALQILVDLILTVGHVLIVTLHGIIAHDGLRRVSEHLGHVEVEGFHTVALFEGEVGITCGLTDHIQRGTLALGNLTYMFDMLLVDEQTHALLTLVGNDLLARQGLVADRQFGHVDLTTALLDEFGETVQVSGRTVVVDRHHGVHILLAEGAHEVVGALLHLGVGTLYGVQFDAVAIAARIHG